jgi:hypothetical protein
MGLATLCIISSLHRIRCGGIFVADGNPNQSAASNMSDYDPHREVVEHAKGKMIEIALQALVSVAPLANS